MTRPRPRAPVPEAASPRDGTGRNGTTERNLCRARRYARAQVALLLDDAAEVEQALAAVDAAGLSLQALGDPTDEESSDDDARSSGASSSDDDEGLTPQELRVRQNARNRHRLAMAVMRMTPAQRKAADDLRRDARARARKDSFGGPRSTTKNEEAPPFPLSRRRAQIDAEAKRVAVGLPSHIRGSWEEEPGTVDRGNVDVMIGAINPFTGKPFEADGSDLVPVPRPRSSGGEAIPRA